MKVALATCAENPSDKDDDAPLHEELKRRGIEVAWPNWRDTEVDWSSFDACVVRSTWDYTAHRKEFIQWAHETSGKTRLFNPAPLMAWNSHKSYLRQLEEHGVRIAPSHWLSRGTEASLESIMHENSWSKALIKPLVGACASGTVRVKNKEDRTGAQRALDELLKHGDAVIQPYLQSVEKQGELSVIVFDGVISHALRKIPKAGDYRVMDVFGATEQPFTLTDKDRALSLEVHDKVVSCSKEARLLYARLDFLWADNGQLVLNEAELIEPMLFFNMDQTAASRFSDALEARLS